MKLQNLNHYASKHTCLGQLAYWSMCAGATVIGSNNEPEEGLS